MFSQWSCLIVVCIALLGCETPINERLYSASKSGEIELVQELLKHGADPSADCDPYAFDREGRRESPFVVACFYGRFEILQTFLKHGISPKIRDDQGNSPVAIVIFSGCSISDSTRLNIVRLLAEYGFDLNCVGETQNPLYSSIASGQFEIAEFLIERGCEVDVDLGGKSILAEIFEETPTPDSIAIGLKLIQKLPSCSNALRSSCVAEKSKDGWEAVRAIACEKARTCESPVGDP